MQVIDNVGVVVSAVAGVILVADIVVQVRAEEKRLDAPSTLGGVFDSLGDVVVGDERLGKDGHGENGRRDRETCVEIQDADGGKTTSFHPGLSYRGE